MLTVTVMLGLPGSGKSTRVAQLLSENPNTVRLNRDLLREMLHYRVYTPENEDIVKQAQRDLLRLALAQGKNVIIDDAGNLSLATQAVIQEWVGNAAEIVYDRTCLSVPIEQCIKQDLRRLPSVGEAVIRSMAEKYLAKPLKPKSDLPPCWVIDVDGCVAILNDREPFNYVAASKDIVYEPIRRLVNASNESTRIVLLTGREETGREVLQDWLDRHFIVFDEIVMRKAGDRRGADIFKKEMILEIMSRFDVELAIDNDPRVISIYRSLGLQTMLVSI